MVASRAVLSPGRVAQYQEQGYLFVRRDGGEVLLEDAPEGGGPCGEYTPTGPH